MAGFGNLWSLTVLCLLRERPMHPYQMQRLIRERHKDEFLDLRRGSLYHAIERLRSASYIEEEETTREGNRPERTVYRITESGEQHLLDWLRHLLAKPQREKSSFVAALSFLPYLTPEDALDHLRLRVNDLECGLVALDAVLKNLVPRIGRLCLIEVEYAMAMRRAELQWVRGLIDELKTRKLTWNREELLNRVCGASLHDPSDPGSPQT